MRKKLESLLKIIKYNYKNMFIIISLVVVSLVSISEFSSHLAVGKLRDEKFLDSFFEKNTIKNYVDSGISDSGDIFYGLLSAPFISRSVKSLTSRWYISGVGRIPRWSKWSKKLDEALIAYYL